MKGRMAQLKERAKSLAIAIADAKNETSRMVLTNELDKVTGEIDSLAAQDLQLHEDATALSDHIAHVEMLAALTGTLREWMATYSFAQRRTLLKILGAQVTVWRHDHSPRSLATIPDGPRFRGCERRLCPGYAAAHGRTQYLICEARSRTNSSKLCSSPLSRT
jgi:hypothetical protein